MPKVTSEFLDTHQYARAEIHKYEAIYGKHFVSPGGEETARLCIGKLAPQDGDRGLDVGCGLGGAAFLMAKEWGARVHGLDLSSNMIASARERCREEGLEDRVTFELGDCLGLAGSGDYQVVYSRDVFLHVHDKERLFTVLHDMLVPGGRLLFTDYCRGEDESSREFEEYVAQRDYCLLAVAEYREHLRRAGFVDLRAEDWTHRFIEIHRRELARLPEAGLPAQDAAEMVEGWQQKIGRAQRGEQRWGFFMARRAA